MKVIKNIASLEEELFAENPNWKHEVYDKIGVLVIATGKEQGKWELVSASCCPYAAKFLDEDVSNDGTENSVEIHGINDMVEYIRGMETYQSFLKDISLGSFTKAELFWAIETRILAVNIVNGGKIYGLSGIYGPGEPCFNDMQQEDLWLDFAVCDYDEIPGIYLAKEHRVSLDDAVANIAKQLEEFRNGQDWTPEDIPLFKYNENAEYHVPATFEELIAAHKRQKGDE